MWLPRGFSLVALKAYPWEGCLKLKCAMCAREAGVSNWTLGPASIPQPLSRQQHGLSTALSDRGHAHTATDEEIETLSGCTRSCTEAPSAYTELY